MVGFKGKVFINSEEIIEQIYKGVQTSDSASIGARELKNCCDILIKKEKPVKIFVDISEIKGNTSGARMTALNTLKTLKYDRMAIYATSIFYRSLANLVIKAAKKEKKIKVFSLRSDAFDWLRK